MTSPSIRVQAPVELTGYGGATRPRICRGASILRMMHSNSQDRASRRVLRVLVIDGQQGTVNACFKLTRRLGHTAFRCFDGFAALRVAVAYQPDVVLLGQGVALLESCQIARHFRFDHPRKDIGIIAVTGKIDDERRNKCTDAGIDILLTEPVDPDGFKTLLMLECMRVNRSEANESAIPPGEGFIAVAGRPPPEEHRDNPTKTSHCIAAAETASE